MALILVRGTGDVGSSVALVLFCAGHRVVLHDSPRPAHARRGMSFTNALFRGKCELCGVYAKYAADLRSLKCMLLCGRAVPVFDFKLEDVLLAIKPEILVDARMRKRIQPEVQRGLAPCTIGLGSNFVAGKTTDLVVETAWGPRLGAVIKRGRSQELAGEPRELGGHRRERFVYAPCAGDFRTRLDIGALVTAGQEIGQIEGLPVLAPLTGRLRGLAHDGALIKQGAKIVEVDASGNRSSGSGVGARPRRIAQGVLTALTGLALSFKLSRKLTK
jgi:xanthine dehydrogenase accessory factor